jgi:hypothetical protein
LQPPIEYATKAAVRSFSIRNEYKQDRIIGDNRISS